MYEIILVGVVILFKKIRIFISLVAISSYTLLFILKVFLWIPHSLRTKTL